MKTRTYRQAQKFPPGTKIHTILGCYRAGVVIPPFPGPFTDGSFRQPTTNEAHRIIYARWSDGTTGWHFKTQVREAENAKS